MSEGVLTPRDPLGVRLVLNNGWWVLRRGTISTLIRGSKSTVTLYPAPEKSSNAYTES